MMYFASFTSNISSTWTDIADKAPVKERGVQRTSRVIKVEDKRGRSERTKWLLMECYYTDYLESVASVRWWGGIDGIHKCVREKARRRLPGWF